MIRLRSGASCATTHGQAAKGVTEATGFEGKTIHRLLEVYLENCGLDRNTDNSLEADLVIVDQVTAVDSLLAHELVPAWSHVASSWAGRH